MDARELAFALDEEKVTAAELRDVLAYMAGRIKSGDDGQTMLDNYWALKQALGELEYWEGTAAEHEAAGAVTPAPAPFSKLFVIDDNRKGIAREQAVPVMSEAARAVLAADLTEQGFCRVTGVPDASVTNGVSHIYYKPGREEYVPMSEHNRQLDLLFASILRGELRGERS